MPDPKERMGERHVESTVASRQPREDGLHERVARAAAWLLHRIETRPEVAIVLGSGLGTISAAVSGVEFPYAQVPAFPRTTVPGHRGRLVVGRMGARNVALFDGRFHVYEGRDPADVTMPIRVAHALGCRRLIVTNAAGGLSPHFRVGDLMVLTDHINLPGLAGIHPLRGPLNPALPSPFVAMRDAYDPRLRQLAMQRATAAGISLRQGVYAMVGGPSYETPAEVRLLRLLGADAVGMSTVHEVIVARYLRMQVVGLSCITNIADAESSGDVDHHAVLAVGQASADRLGTLVSELLGALPEFREEG